ncbi:oxidoreductase [Altererythrobacter sp. MF3-039]|uniref:oxidoreductase n=1 Tax=Altererythrobacter sp. MF3-039 TaxID=3252901 RepID=UPI00390C78C2
MPKIIDTGIRDWTPGELPNLKGKRYFITGGNSGIGLEAAKILAKNNADVVIGARDQAKGEAAVAEVSLCGPGKISLVQIDLADLSSVRSAAEQVTNDFGPLDALINNAGIMQTPKQKTADGFEMQLGTNHLGHFLLSGLLFPLVGEAGGRIVTVSSIAHKFGWIDFDNLMLERGYERSRAYAQSKYANLVFAIELHRRLRAGDSSVASIACHPGYSATSLTSTGPNAVMAGIYSISNAIFAQPAELGAFPTVLGAADLRAESGAYYGPRGLFDARGPVGDAEIERRALKEDVAKRLWEVSEALVDFEWRLP